MADIRGCWSEFAAAAANVKDRVVDTTANVKDRVVDAVTDMSETATDNARRLARQTVEGVQRGADYFRNNGMQQMADDLRDYAKANPTQALIGAAVVGFCLGRLMSRDMRR